MSLSRHPAWTRQRALHADLHTAFGALFSEDAAAAPASADAWVPRVDIREEAGRFLILADLPGVDPKTIEINMDKGVLSVSGERRADENPAEGRNTRVERVQGAFHRRFALPDSANPEGIVATGKHGVLEISIPKRPETTPRRIEVQ